MQTVYNSRVVVFAQIEQVFAGQALAWVACLNRWSEPAPRAKPTRKLKHHSFRGQPGTIGFVHGGAASHRRMEKSWVNLPAGKYK